MDEEDYGENVVKVLKYLVENLEDDEIHLFLHEISNKEKEDSDEM